MPVVARSTCRVAFADGQRPALIRKGKVYEDSDPVVKARPDLFEAPDQHAKRTARPTNTAELGAKSMSSRKIERATKAPGEKRNVRRKDDDDTTDDE